jgi:membrane-bound ClpP family serine protease
VLDFVGYVGRQTEVRLNRYADQAAFLYRILRQILVNPRTGRGLRLRIVIEQIYFTAVEALWIVIPIALLLGSMMILQLSGVAAQHDLGKIIGDIGEAKTDIFTEGSVQVGSELWSARSDALIPSGSKVRIVKRDGFTLEVEPAPSNDQ